MTQSDHHMIVTDKFEPALNILNCGLFFLFVFFFEIMQYTFNNYKVCISAVG